MQLQRTTTYHQLQVGYQKQLDNKIYIYKTGWEYVEKASVQLTRIELESKFVTFYPSWQVYSQQMRVRIWDFLVRYCMKPLRLSEKEMLDFDTFINTFVRQRTSFRPRRGKVMVWAIASMYFFAQLKLQGIHPFEINLERLSEIFDLTCPQKMSDFKKVMVHLKQAHHEQMASENVEKDLIIYEACKALQANENTMIRHGASYIAKKITTEYTGLSFRRDPQELFEEWTRHGQQLTEKKQKELDLQRTHFLISDQIISLLGLLLAYEFFDTTVSLSHLIASFSQQHPDLASHVTPKHLMQYYSELSTTDFENLTPVWLTPLRKPEKFTHKSKLKP